jgi:AcrR family transcriptional regulator
MSVQYCTSMRTNAASKARGSVARVRIQRAAFRLFAQNGGGAITVSDLAEAAGIARGTIYNNVENPENLFAEVATSLSHEMIGRIEATMCGVADPVERLAMGTRLFIRRAHEEPDWGRFLVRFALNAESLQSMLGGPPARDIAEAVRLGRFKATNDKIAALATMLTGSTLAAMNAVIGGNQTWRNAGTNSAELFLRAGGIAAAEAHRIAARELPALAPARPEPTVGRGKS